MVLDLDGKGTVCVRRRRFVLEGKPVPLATSHLPMGIVAGSAITEENTGPSGRHARLADLGFKPVHFREEIRSRALEGRGPAIRHHRPAVHLDAAWITGEALHQAKVSGFTLGEGDDVGDREAIRQGQRPLTSIVRLNYDIGERRWRGGEVVGANPAIPTAGSLRAACSVSGRPSGIYGRGPVRSCAAPAEGWLSCPASAQYECAGSAVVLSGEGGHACVCGSGSMRRRLGSSLPRRHLRPHHLAHVLAR